MCGITGIHFKNPGDRGIGRKNLDALVNELLLGIEDRGKDATGIVSVAPNGEVTMMKRAVTAKTFVTQRKRLPFRAQTILAHTRFATQGTPKNMENNHPVQYRSCYAIHNGHIYNDDALFVEHSLERGAEVDSEIIPALFFKFGLDKAHLALQEFSGNMAVAVVDPDRFPGQLILAKGWSSPLHFIETEKVVCWSSDKDAIKDAAKKALDVDIFDNQIESLNAGELLYIDNASVDKYKFTVESRVAKRATYTYTSSYSTDYSSNWGPGEPPYGTAKEKRRWRMACENCGCEGLYHGASKPFTEGACFRTIINKETGHRSTCACMEFVEVLQAIESGPIGDDWCDTCSEIVPKNELTRCDSWMLCRTCLGKDDPLGSPKITDWQEKEAVVHAEALKLVAKATGSKESFIEWLLFECPSEILEQESNSYLRTKHAEFDDLYFAAEDMARQLETKDEIDPEVEEAMQHLFDIATETECSIEVFEGEEMIA